LFFEYDEYFLMPNHKLSGWDQFLHFEFVLACVSFLASWAVFFRIFKSRPMKASILNKYVIWMAGCDIVLSSILIFLLWPQWIYWEPNGVEAFTSKNDGKFYAAMPNFFHGFKHLLFFLFVLQTCMWFASFTFWFIIALNLWQILRQNLKLFPDYLVHTSVWGVTTLFFICLYFFIDPDFDNFPNEKNHPDWVIMSFSNNFVLYIFGSICLSYLMFGLMLVFKTFCTTGLHPLRLRMSTFIGFTVLLTAPMFAELLLGWSKYMTFSLATLGLCNALVWLTSSQFHQCFKERSCNRSLYSTGASFSAFYDGDSVTEDESAFRIFGSPGSIASNESDEQTIQEDNLHDSVKTENELKTYPQFFHA